MYSKHWNPEVKTIRRDSDGAWIPANEGNADYQEFLKWKDAGNTPAQMVDPDAAAKAKRAQDEARMRELAAKPVLTTPELTEAVKLLLSRSA